MPLYEYWCERCELWFEKLGSMSNSMDPKPCPQCGEPAERQMPSSFAPFTMRDGYPRGVPDKGLTYGPISNLTPQATPKQKHEAAEAEKRKKWEYSINERADKSYKKKWDEPKTATKKSDNP